MAGRVVDFATSSRRALAIVVLVAAIVGSGGTVAAHAAADVTYAGIGYVGVTNAQTVSLDVANEATTTTCSASLEFFNITGKLVKSASVSIAGLHGAFLAYAPAVAVGTRVELRPVVVSIGDSCGAFHASVSVSDNATDSVRVRLQIGDPEG